MYVVFFTIGSYLNQDQLTDREVKNFTSDWSDGTTIAALVDALAPGLCPEYAIMNPQKPLENASHAMKLAEDWLDVPQVRSTIILGLCYVSSVQG